MRTSGIRTPAWHRLGQRPGLDGLRGVAIVLVLVGHAGTGTVDMRRYVAFGTAGVSLFFTLSGYLITTLLLDERNQSGTIDLMAFYGRRARRLLPGLAALVVPVGVLMVAGGDWLPVAGSSFYFANWLKVDGVGMWVLSHTWSLSVEEQFYIVWPLIMLAVLRRRRGPSMAACVALFIACTATCAMYADGASMERLYYGTDVRATSVLIGCLLAAVTAGRGDSEVRSAGTVLYAGIASVVALAWFIGYESRELDAVAPVAMGALSAGLLWLARGPGVLAWAPLRYLGRRSYGLYLWHFPVLLTIFAYASGPTATMAGLAVSLAITELSWRLIERPWLRTSARRPSAEPLDRDVTFVATSCGADETDRVELGVSDFPTRTEDQQVAG